MLDSKSVFLIDDDSVANFCNRDVLNELNYFEKIEEFPNAQLALARIRELIEQSGELPKYLFVDIRMPKMDGFEFVEELEYLIEDHGLVAYPEIVMLTSSKHKRDKELFDKCQLAHHYINKPLDLNDVKDTLGIIG
jgi:CheY-like chemotaxis protein